MQKQNQNGILFIERCLTLLKPGGRLGIVLLKVSLTIHPLPTCVSFAKTAPSFAP